MMHDIGLERKRDGAYAWGVFEDAAVEGRFVETFLVQSLLELKYLRARVTNADQVAEAQAHKYLTEPPKPTFLVAPARHRAPRGRPTGACAGGRHHRGMTRAKPARLARYLAKMLRMSAGASTASRMSRFVSICPRWASISAAARSPSPISRAATSAEWSSSRQERAARDP